MLSGIRWLECSGHSERGHSLMEGIKHLTQVLEDGQETHVRCACMYG